MLRPIIVLAVTAQGEISTLYVGENSTDADQAFTTAAADTQFHEVALYYYPQPRQVASPSANAQVAEASRSMQRDVAKEDRLSAILTRARTKIKAAKSGQIEAQALADAEKEIDAEIAAKNATPESRAAEAEGKAKAAAVAQQALGVIRENLTTRPTTEEQYKSDFEAGASYARAGGKLPDDAPQAAFEGFNSVILAPNETVSEPIPVSAPVVAQPAPAPTETPAEAADESTETGDHFSGKKSAKKR